MTSSGKERGGHSDPCGILAAMRTGQSRWDEGQSRRGGPVAPAGYAASKVPLITAYFWIIKLLSTAMGEATSDYMVRTINPVIAVLLGFTGFVIAMVLQFRAKAYNAWIYWLAVVMVAVFGTQAADVLHIKFGVPYIASTTFYAVVLAVIFVLWYRTEGTLSIHSIRTPRRELFYWATVLATFAMGTATGDMTAKTLNLGYLASGIWFSIAFAAVAVAHWKFHLNPILAFWIAYVLTRPVGASFADYVAFPHSVGGLGVGHGPVALVLTVVIAILVGYLAVTRKDVEDPRRAAPAGPARRHPTEQQQPGYPPAPPRPGRPDPPLRYPDEQYPDERYPDERYADGRYQGQRYPGQRYVEEQYPADQYRTRADPRERYREEPYPGDQYRAQQDPRQQHREEPYPGDQYRAQQDPRQQHREEPYPGDQYRDQQDPRERYREEPYAGGQHPGQRYPEDRSRGEEYRGRRHSGEQYPGERYPGQPRPAPPRPAPPGQPHEPRSPQERQPSRQSRQPPEPGPDDDEAEHTAWGFFMWDE